MEEQILLIKQDDDHVTTSFRQAEKILENVGHLLVCISEDEAKTSIFGESFKIAKGLALLAYYENSFFYILMESAHQVLKKRNDIKELFDARGVTADVIGFLKEIENKLGE